MNPRVSMVTPTEDYKLHLVFSNGEEGIYDCHDLLNFGVFKELQDRNYFKNRLPTRRCGRCAKARMNLGIRRDNLYTIPTLFFKLNGNKNVDAVTKDVTIYAA